MKASDLMVRALEEEGVKHIFGVPGEENLDLLESIRTSSIELIVTRHEQGAAFMAATYGRLTGRAGVCLSTLGPGATNFVTPAAYAQLGGFPLIMITGQKPIKKSKQGQFQIVDIVSLMEPTTKMSKQVIHGDTIPAIIRESFRVAEEERPGAVLIELPEDIAAEETTTAPFKRHDRYYAVADKEVISKAVEVIKNAKRPLLLLGAGANRKESTKALTQFVESTNIPFFNTQMGKGVIDERNELFMGTAALSSGDYLHCAVDQADLIINVGHDVIEKPPFFMGEDDKQVIHINYKSAKVDEVYFPQVEVVGDIPSSINALKKALDGFSIDDNSFKGIKEKIDEKLSEGVDDPRFPIIPQRLVADVRKIMGEDGIIALDNGMYKLWFARNYPSYRRLSILLDNALATMGAGLPSAMMVSMLKPGRKVMSICGDGGFMMNSQEMETAVRLKLDLVVLVLNDSSYGMIRWKQTACGFKDWGLSFGNPDFVMYAESYGAHGYRLKNTEEFVDVVNGAFEKGGVHLIEVPMDYTENTKVFIEELSKMSCDLI